MSKRTSLLLALLLVLSLGLVACNTGSGGDSGSNNAAGASPADTVRAYFDALAALDGAALTATVCDLLTESVSGVVDPLAAARDAAVAAGVEFSIDTSAISYTVDSQDGSSARVSVSGQINMTAAGGMEQTFEATELAPGDGGVVYLVSEDGSWKICADVSG